MMQALDKDLRSALEKTVKAARTVAEAAAHAAVDQLGVGHDKPEAFLSDAEKALRNRLRTHGKQLGDARDSKSTNPTYGKQEVQHLVQEVAYQHWHRMLFARFLADNNLLMYDGVAVTIEECDELAPDEGAKSGWELAGKLAARMLPQVFKPGSPVFELTFAPEHQSELERLLKDLHDAVFKASDSLGWVYQFWQADNKERINKSEVKIGADELPAVTQLFTEPYMVAFLLHNSLGAWWATRHPGKPCPVNLDYFRTLEDGMPAAGKFEGWPDSLADFKLLDPCCGSGHFLVAAFLMLVPMRMAAEGLSAKDAVNRVLAENIHGLELDPRCVEIAVFAVALEAWRYQDASGKPLGVREIPAPNIACCGLKVAAKAQDWEALVPDDAPNAEYVRQELRQLHASFAQAPLLGSLLDPSKSLKNDLATSSYETLTALLRKALATERTIDLLSDDANRWELALSAQGLLDAVRLLDGRYHLVVTNVPYLARGGQDDNLKAMPLHTTSPRILKQAHMLNTLHEIPDPGKAKPERFDAGLSIALATQEATEHGDLPDDFTNGRWLSRRFFLRQDVRPLPLCLGQQRTGAQVWMGAPQSDQARQTPGHEHIHGQRQLQLDHAAQLQGFDTAAVFEHVEERFYFPATAVPVDPLHHLGKVARHAIGQQMPLHRLAACWRVRFLGHYAGHRQLATRPIGNVQGARPNLLAHHAGSLGGARCQGEFNLAQGCGLHGLRPQFAAVGQGAVVFRAHQPVRRMPQIAGTAHHFNDVRFTIAHANQARIGQALRHLADALVSLAPAQTLPHTASRAIVRLGCACPHPSVGDTQRFAFGRDGIGRVQVHAALGFVGQGPEAFDALPVEIQLGGVLQAQHDAVLSHPCCGALDVRGQHRFPFQGAFGVVGLIEKSLRPLRFAPIRTCPRNAGCGLVGKSLRELDQAMIQARISQLRSCKFFCCPCHRCLSCLKMNQAGKRHTRLNFSSIAGTGAGFKEEGCV